MTNRYLVRLENSKKYSSRDVALVAASVRQTLGSNEAVGHLRVSGKAIEFDLFVKDSGALQHSRRILEEHLSKIVTLKPLDKAPVRGEKSEIFKEGISLFNDERFWEAHEVLEQVWQPAQGEERQILQGLIMVAAAMVHAQRNRNDRCIAMLKKADQKLAERDTYMGVDLKAIRKHIEQIIQSKDPKPFQINL